MNNPSVFVSRPREGLIPSIRGAAYVEMLLVFIPLFTMFLAMVQMGLMYTAKLVVTHAANVAARAAVVILDDDPKRYRDEERNHLENTGGESDDSATDSFAEWSQSGNGSTGNGPGGSDGASSGSEGQGARLAAIRDAASIPLLAVSPSMSALIDDPRMLTAIGGDPLMRAATGAALYNRAAVAVTFPSAPRASVPDNAKSEWSHDEEITVRVTYLFHCGVPIVHRIMCSSPGGAASDLVNGLRNARTASDFAAVVERQRILAARREREAPGRDELRSAQTDWLQTVMGVAGNYFAILRSEATLPNHGANFYEYREE